MLSPISSRIHGPVFPILPAFTSTGEFDKDSTANYVQYLVANGAQILLVTAGTSRLNLLSVDEIKSLNAIVCENKGADGLAIAANPDFGSLATTLDIVTAAADSGADAFLLYYSERYYNDETTVGFYEAVTTEVDLPLLIHAMPMRGASTGPTIVHNYDCALVRKLLKLSNIIGMKEENGNEGLRQRLLLEFSDQLAFIVAGGGMGKFLTSRVLGAQAYLTGIGNIDPRLASKFFNHCQNEELDDARTMVSKLEQPFFDIAVPLGWHVALKGALSIAGLMPVFERLPLRPSSDEQLSKLAAIMKTKQIGSA